MKTKIDSPCGVDRAAAYLVEAKKQRIRAVEATSAEEAADYNSNADNYEAAARLALENDGDEDEEQ